MGTGIACSYGASGVTLNAACWAKYPTCPATLTAAQNYQYADEEKMDYWLGVAKPIHYGIYGCKPGFRLVNDTNNVFLRCESDLQDQCVAPTGGVRSDAQSALCGNHGTCDIDWTLTNANRGSINVVNSAATETNDVWKSCTCTDGYISPPGFGYCTVQPCKDWTGTSQVSCLNHGDSQSPSCRAPTGGGAYKCFCSSSWAGEVCQWPMIVPSTIGVLSDTTRRQQVEFVYHGPTDGSNVDPSKARYSLRFSGSSAQTYMITEAKSQVTAQLRIKNKCFQTPQTSDAFALLLPLYRETTAATNLILDKAFQNTWVLDCLLADALPGSADDFCQLPFQRTGLVGDMQDVCEPPEQVAEIQFELGSVYCTMFSNTHPWSPSPTLPSTHRNYFCWTPAGFSSQMTGVPTGARSDAGKLVVNCVFSDVAELWTIINVSGLNIAWFHVYTAMKNAGCI